MIPPRVLVVDDDPSVRGMLVDVLDGEGYDSVVAANGDEALTRIAERRPDLLLLDLQMPILDGPGVARALQKQGIHIPTVLMTAVPDIKRWAQVIHASDFVAKPFDVIALLAIVARLCGVPHP